jgi:flagellar basal body L-ring protein FlgH
MEMNNYKFERVENFKCLGVTVDEDNNDNQTDWQERIKNANKTYFVLQTFFENKNLSKKPKLSLKNTTIDKTLTDATETGTDSNSERLKGTVTVRD